MFIKKYYLVVLAVINFTINSHAQQKPKPLGVPGNWTFVDNLSDEFNGRISNGKWTTNHKFPAWTSNSNLVKTKNKKLVMSIDWNKHKRNGRDFYFKSGVIKSKQKIKYGYFEVKMKGSSKFPGGSPAFWLLNKNINSSQDVKYTEIDCPELQSIKNNANTIALNVIHIKKNNKRVPIRQPLTTFNPSGGFHVYGCNWTPEKIEFFIDGKKVKNTVPNKVHKYPMNVILSIGLREPYITYDSNGYMLPVKTLQRPAKFPIQGEVEYVRVWKSNSGSNRFVAESEILDPESPDEARINVNQEERKLNVNLTKTLSNSNIKVFDIQGKKMIDQSFNENNFTVNLSFLNNGLYIVRVENGEEILVKKILVQ